MPEAETEPDTNTGQMPNQVCAKARRGHSVRRRLLTWLGLLPLLVILGALGWGQVRLLLRQAAAPVLAMADDGTLRINGKVIVIGPDGLPPKALEALEGGPPEEVVVEAGPPVWSATSLHNAVSRRGWTREWYYRRLGLPLVITRYVDGVRAGALAMEGGAVRYEAVWVLGLGSSTFHREVVAGTVEFRGQRWWLGEPGPLGTVSERQMLPCRRSGDNDHGEWILRAGPGRLLVKFETHDWLENLRWPWLRRQVGRSLREERLSCVELCMPAVPGGTVAAKSAAIQPGARVQDVW